MHAILVVLFFYLILQIIIVISSSILSMCQETIKLKWFSFVLLMNK